MGTFHQGKHELHGITVVVETDGADLFVGRVDDIDDRGVILNDVDVHREGESERSREEYLDRAAKLGVFPRHRRLLVPADRVSGIRRLGDL